MLHEACRHCDGFATVFKAAHAAHPSSPDAPWGIVLYNDEIAHNPFQSGEDTRKCHGVYWTLLELGEAALHSKNAWFVTAAVRSILIKHLVGSISHLDKLILKQLFFDSAGGNDFRTGIELAFKDNEYVQLFASFKCFVGDGDALKHVLHCKGSSGFKICFCCDVVDHTAPNQIGYVPSTCLDPAMITRTDNATVYTILEELAGLAAGYAAGVRGAKTAMDKHSKHYGWNFEANNVFLDEDLRLMIAPVSSCMFDWFHIYCVSGIWNFELFYLVMYLRARDRDILKNMGDFVHSWTYPKSTCHPRNVVGEVSFADDDHIKCDGAEALHIFRLIAVYLVLFCNTERSQMIQSYLLLCDVLELVTNIKRNALGRITPMQLRDAIFAHLAKFLEAYRGIGWKPKFHWATELWRMYERFEFLLGLLVTERRHKIVKRWSKDRLSQESFEAGVVEEVTLQHLTDLREPWLVNDCLVDEIPPAAKLMRELRGRYRDARFISSSNSARVNHMLFTKGDVALVRNGGVERAGEIYFFARVDSQNLVCVSFWDRAPTRNDTMWTRTYRKRDRPQILPLTTLLCPVLYLDNLSGATLLIPYMFR
jgi:hypothetical protein